MVYDGQVDTSRDDCREALLIFVDVLHVSVLEALLQKISLSI